MFSFFSLFTLKTLFPFSESLTNTYIHAILNVPVLSLLSQAGENNSNLDTLGNETEEGVV